MPSEALGSHLPIRETRPDRSSASFCSWPLSSTDSSLLLSSLSSGVSNSLLLFFTAPHLSRFSQAPRSPSPDFLPFPRSSPLLFFPFPSGAPTPLPLYRDALPFVWLSSFTPLAATLNSAQVEIWGLSVPISSSFSVDTQELPFLGIPARCASNVALQGPPLAHSAHQK